MNHAEAGREPVKPSEDRKFSGAAQTTNTKIPQGKGHWNEWLQADEWQDKGYGGPFG